MKKEKIEYIIKKFGYELDKWIPLTEFPIIFLSQDAACYTNPNDRRVRFNSSIEALEVVRGRIGENGFVAHTGETDPSKFIPDDIIQFSLIHGLVASSSNRGSNTYLTKEF